MNKECLMKVTCSQLKRKENFTWLRFRNLESLKTFLTFLSATDCVIKKENWRDPLMIVKARLKTISRAEYQDILDIYELFKASNN